MKKSEIVNLEKKARTDWSGERNLEKELGGEGRQNPRGTDLVLGVKKKKYNN